MKVYIFIFLLIVSANSLAQIVNTKEYFLLKENQIDHFTGKFVWRNDPNLKELGISLPPPPAGKSYRDTTIYKEELTYKTVYIEGHKAYYAVNIPDTSNDHASVGPNHFLFSALLFKRDTVFLAPIYGKDDLNKLRLSDFRYFIPPVVKAWDTIVVIDGKKKILLYDFKKVTILLNGKAYKDCLNIQIIERWPEESYSGQVWLSKKYGVLKWIRTTGRIDIRDL